MNKAAVHPIRAGPPSSFEDILVLINPLGRWQARTYFPMGFIMVFFASINLAITFMQITPDYACTLPFDNNWTIEQMKTIGSPLTVINEHIQSDACFMYSYNFTDFENKTYDEALKYSQAIRNSTGIVTCASWMFDTSINMEKTLVTQFGLVCDKALYVEHAQLIYMGGFLVGALVAGILSDNFGRKTVVIGATVTGSVSGIALGLSPNFVIFAIIRFFLGMCNAANLAATFCLALEMTTSKWRIWVGGLFFMPFALGYTLLPLFAFLIRDWRFMHMAIAAPTLIAVFYWWLIPESPRWLLVKGRLDDAERIIRKAANENRRQLPMELHLSNIAQATRKEDSKSENRVNILTVFTFKDGRLQHPRMAARAVNIFFNWFVNAMVYYGVSLNVSSFAGDVFVNNAIAGAVEFPACMICVPLLYWGRKKGLATTLLLAGACLFVVPWFNESMTWLKLVFVMAGKLCITASFALVYVFTIELYPTVIRNSGLATSSCIARIGSMLAPYISSIGKFVSDVCLTHQLISNKNRIECLNWLDTNDHIWRAIYCCGTAHFVTAGNVAQEIAGHARRRKILPRRKYWRS